MKTHLEWMILWPFGRGTKFQVPILTSEENLLFEAKSQPVLKGERINRFQVLEVSTTGVETADLDHVPKRLGGWDC